MFVKPLRHRWIPMFAAWVISGPGFATDAGLWDNDKTKDPYRPEVGSSSNDNPLVEEGSTFNLVSAVDAEAPTAIENENQAIPAQDLWRRKKLTGDWGGARSRLERKGVTLDAELTQFYQGLVSGTRPGNFDYSGRLDALLTLDTGKLGLWKGGGLHSHLEYRFGDDTAAWGGSFFINNTAIDVPSVEGNTLEATSLYLSQQVGDRTSLLIGKINVLDLLAKDLFFGGWGIHRFMNVVFAAPPSGLVPPVFFGAIANVKTEPVNLSFWVFDSDDRTDEYWPNDLFENGVTFSLGGTFVRELAGRPTTLTFTGLYTTKSGVDFSRISRRLRPRLETSTKNGAYNVSLQLSHLLRQDPRDPRQGWGVFMKAAIADGNPNYVQNSLIAGIGGTGLFPGRERDNFGLGYYYYDLSDALQDSLNPTRERFGDEQGIELYYSYAVTPWFHVTADLQYIDPPRGINKNAFIAGLRANLRF